MSSKNNLPLNFEQKKNVKALSITVGIHLLLLLIFLLWKFPQMKSQAADGFGMEVNLGTSDDGFGFDQPEKIGSPKEYEANLPSQAEIQAITDINVSEANTTNQGDAPAVNISQRNNKKNSTSMQENTVPTPNQKAKYSYAGSTGDGTGNDANQDKDGSNEGIGQGDGDMGVPSGTPGSKNYKGIPRSGGISAFVGNRKLVNRPNPKAEYRDGGKVVFDVTVNRKGEIISHRVTSASNPQIQAIALEKIKHAKFNPDPNSPVEMFGTITFDFITR